MVMEPPFWHRQPGRNRNSGLGSEHVLGVQSPPKIRSTFHFQRCHILEMLLSHSDYNQVQFLWTVMQPALHRDFMYSAKTVFPSMDFTPISTTYSRMMKEKIRNQRETFHRIQSAYLHDSTIGVANDGQVVEVKVRKSQSATCTLPSILRHEDGRMCRKKENGIGLLELHERKSVHPFTNRKKSNDVPNKPDLADSEFHQPRFTTRQCKILKEADVLPKETWEFIRSGPATYRFLGMAPRRHVQDEEVTKHQEAEKESGDVAETFSIRLWKKRRKNKLIERSATDLQGEGFQPAEEERIRLQPNLEAFRGISAEGWQVLAWYAHSWDELQRNEFLHKLVLKLDQRQHYFISSYLSVKQCRDFITLLPKKLALKILSYLSPCELMTASRVCKSWQKLCNNNRLWKAKCQEVHLDIPVIQRHPKWKNIFRENKYLKHNWNQGNCKTVDIKGHTQSVLCVTFDYTCIASGSLDKTIKIWDIKTGSLLQTLKGHLKGVWCLEFFTDSLLVSGSYDCTLRIWNLRTGLTLRTMIGHDGPIWAIVRRDNTLVSGSQDKTAKIWDISRCLLLKTLQGHTGAVYAVDMDEDGTIAVTGSADKTVRMWDVSSGDCTSTLSAGHTMSVMSVSWSKGLLACSYGDTIALYHMAEGTLIKTYKEHEKRIECVKIKIGNPAVPEGVIVSGGQDGMVKYWDLTKDQSVHTFEGHTHAVNCISFNELQIASASMDNKVKIWDFNIENVESNIPDEPK